jgi:TrmH family RNA methyltransferase
VPQRRTITGFSNPTVKYLRSLRDKKHRRRERKFLAEGLRLLTDARETGHVPEMLVMAAGREPHPLLAALEAEVERAGGARLPRRSRMWIAARARSSSPTCSAARLRTSPFR